MRFLLAALAAAALLPASLRAEPVAASTAAPAAVAHPRPDVTDWFAGPLAPHLMAWDMDERGLSRYPFDARDTFVNGAAAQVWTRLSHQFTESSREANFLEAGLRLDGRLGGDFEYGGYRVGAFNSVHKPDWASLHGVADLSQGDRDTWEYGFGIAALFADRTRVGPGLELRYERRLRAPWTVYAKYAPAFLSDGRFWHEAYAGIGPNWKNLGADVSYRVLLNGSRDSYGPELALRCWF